MYRFKFRPVLLLVTCLGAAALLAPAANAVPAGTGVRGTVTITWGGISGAPITSWNGTLGLEFDPSAAARQSILAASTDPALGEPWRPLFGPQVQAARVTQLVSDKTETVLCQNDDLSSYEATATSSVASLGDPRTSFEILAPSVDLIAGTGSISLHPYVQSNSGAGDTGWWVNDRLVVPARWTSAGTFPCPGPASNDPAARQQRVLAVNGMGAAPVTVYDWLAKQPGTGDFRLRRTTAGWRVLADATRRETFSESRFGPQDTQQLDLRVQSQLYLAGSLTQIGARCVVPRLAIERARTSAAAVLLAKRAGLTNTTFAGTRRGFGGLRTRYVIESPSIDSTSHAPCMRGRYRIWRYPKGA
ncbi:MAG: hypothetical protein JWL76_2446 [Thermoleophilia bacterium]|nr:hypothetical protein [Thermoleophilia bacterium]